jgi:hypothetical protein
LMPALISTSHRANRSLALTVVLSIQIVYQSLNTRLVQMPNVTRRLPCLLSTHDRMRIDSPERINNDFSPDGLNRIDNDGDGARVQLLE